MAKNTPYKRKSTSITNGTPNKISKILDTPISKNIYKSPTSATKVIKKQVNGSKTSKSPNKNQKNGKQITARGRKKSKQIEKVEFDDESDDSMDELNGNNDSSHDATDEEVDLSDEQIDQADSDKEAEVAEEADDSDEKIGSNEEEVDEADSDEEAEVAEEADDSDEEVGSNEEQVDEADSDEEAEVVEETDSDEEEADDSNEEEADDSDEEVGSKKEQVDEADSDEEDDKKNDDAHEAKNNYQESYFSVFVTGLNAKNVQLKNLFPGCNIDFVTYMKDKKGLFIGQACVIFKDQKSMTKALEKDNTKFDDSVIKVEAINLSEFCINVIGVDEHTNLYKIFRDCNIIATRRFTHPVTNEPSDRAYVFLKDKESLEKALAKMQIKDNGRKIRILLPDNLTLFVSGIKPNENIYDIFRGCSIHAYKILRYPVTNQQTGKAHITFKDEDSVKKALEKNGTESGGSILTVETRIPWFEIMKRTGFTAFVKNLSSNTKLEEVFKDCKIKWCTLLRNPTTNTFTGRAFVNLEDEEGLQKALLKNETEYDGHVITVTRKGCSVFVRNLNKDSKVEDIFKDCKIQLIRMKTNEIGTFAFVHFKDKDSYEKALSKDKTEFEGKTIHVEACRSKEDKNSANARSYSNPIRNSLDSGSKVAILKKKLLSELRAQAQQLEREIYGNSKPLYKKKP